jgi:hypothetical protein
MSTINIPVLNVEEPQVLWVPFRLRSRFRIWHVITANPTHADDENLSFRATLATRYDTRFEIESVNSRGFESRGCHFRITHYRTEFRGAAMAAVYAAAPRLVSATGTPPHPRFKIIRIVDVPVSPFAVPVVTLSLGTQHIHRVIHCLPYTRKDKRTLSCIQQNLAHRHVALPVNFLVHDELLITISRDHTHAATQENAR